MLCICGNVLFPVEEKNGTCNACSEEAKAPTFYMYKIDYEIDCKKSEKEQKEALVEEQS